MASTISKSLSRVTVALKSAASDGFPVTAPFLECIVRYFEPREHFVTVKCSYQDNLLTLCGPMTDTEHHDDGCSGTHDSTVVLQHSEECPFANICERDAALVRQDEIERGVAVGVSVVLESSDNRILMTRRASHLRTYPNAWVPPGGHMDLNESIVQAGLRELEEETGIHLEESSTALKVLCLWEAVYPVLLGLGPPKRHYVVVYLHAIVDKPWQDIHQSIKLDPEEVKACTWLTPEIVSLLLIGDKEKLGTHHSFVVGDDKSLQPCPLELKSMFSYLLWKEGKVYSGSQLALTKWMEIVNSRSPPSKM
ncbi:nucleoside diphosphate-linked moiety X motif 17-like [Ischnura elegans]|uniref:nucleoside diphosphate-linked moiety X motif 17-like n=1 Tax=Ischnura elegans TaxID=197161 RepID=UPI001ED8B44A|nr:nucleoside diphosphate-linked moiety X motif 17-like [Ischnura elegans]